MLQKALCTDPNAENNRPWGASPNGYIYRTAPTPTAQLATRKSGEKDSKSQRMRKTAKRDTKWKRGREGDERVYLGGGRRLKIIKIDCIKFSKI